MALCGRRLPGYGQDLGSQSGSRAARATKRRTEFAIGTVFVVLLEHSAPGIEAEDDAAHRLVVVGRELHMLRDRVHVA